MSTRHITRSGFCPTLKKDYSVSVEQLGTTTLKSTHEQYIDGRFTCEYASQHDCSLAAHCPVAKITH